MNLEEKLAPLMDYLETEIKGELERQGHIATGKLRDQIKVYLTGNTIVGTAGEAFYAKYVDWGRRPGGKRVPIQALINWIEIKGLAHGNKAIQMAWAVQYAIWKNGVPTDKNEGKKMFVTNVLERSREKIFNDIKNAIGFYFNAEIENIIRQVKYVRS
jgi:hypothetical protein